MSLADISLSDYGRASSTPSPVNRMMSSFASDFRPGRDINLGVGYVNEKTIPQHHIITALQEVLSRPDIYKAALNYGGPQGSANLIRSLQRCCREGGLPQDVLEKREIIIGPSGATSLLESAAHVLKRGIVLTPDPMYYIYCNFLERLGYEVITVPEDHRGIRLDLLEQTIGHLGDRAADISFIYVVTVNNPTGSILADSRRKDLAEIATHLSGRLGRRVPLLVDTAYEDLVHDESVGPLRSLLLHDRLGIVFEIGTLSKILSPALRVGYMIGSPGPLMRAMVQKTSDVGFSAPMITQEIASYMLDHHMREQAGQVNRGYRKKALSVGRWIRDRLGAYLEDICGGQAGFYFYLTFRDIRTDESSAFFRYCTRTTGDPALDGPPHDRQARVLYVPGEFCVHPRGPLAETGKRQLRFSYGFEELEQLEIALKIMQEAAGYAAGK